MNVIFTSWCIASLMISTHFITTSAFTVPRIQHLSSCMNNNNYYDQRWTSKTRLNDVSEWRDMMFDEISISDLDEEIDEELIKDGPLREICVLPFPYENVILQGETKELRLYEERFINLFNDCMENHSGIVAMGLLAQSGVIQSVPLCEIEAYNRIEGFGIFVTIRVVGRASLVTLTEQEPYMKAICSEKIDKISHNLDLHNLLASNIENTMVTISSMEFKLKQADTNSNHKDDYSTSAATTLDNDTVSPSNDANMRRRIFEAQLEKQFIDDDTYSLDDDDYDEDEDDDDYEYNLDRSGRFRSAFKTAKATDHQGYIKPLSASRCERSLQDLTAISWAAFCTDEDAQETTTYRIQALDCDELFERLKLGSHMVKEKKENLEQLMKKNGIKFESRDDDSFPPPFGSEKDIL